jgi:hypothetical protein
MKDAKIDVKNILTNYNGVIMNAEKFILIV